MVIEKATQLNMHYEEIENWKKYCVNNGYSAAVLVDLPKASDTIGHDFLIVNIQAYRLRGNSLKPIMNYLRNRYQNTKVNSSFKRWEELPISMPQGSVLGSLLFNVYLIDLLYIA